MNTELKMAGSTLDLHELKAAGSHVEIGGELYYRIENVDAMPPFLMSVVSDSDHWMFASSTGTLTAGRHDPDRALFPYTTDDRIHDSQDLTGGKTIIRLLKPGAVHLWEPFSNRYEGLYNTTRSLAKNVLGNKLIFEEINHDLQLSFCVQWMNSERFGFIRRSTLANHAAEAAQIQILDGVQNVLPAGLTRRFQMEYSTLADGYKESELDLASGIGLFRLSSIPADRAEPNESLRANTVWSEGLPAAKRLLSIAQISKFRRGEAVAQELLNRGRRGAYLLVDSFEIAAGQNMLWSVVLEVEQDACAVAELRKTLEQTNNLSRALEVDVELGSKKIIKLVAASDGLQKTEDPLHSWRHFSNVLFNLMRGGIPANGYSIDRKDFCLFVEHANVQLYANNKVELEQLPSVLQHHALLNWAGKQRNADLERLAYEYLPLTFSRRHGDPSRPWNIFAIDVKGAGGESLMNYQGNWRDIFQNWEALATSYPGFVESMIFKFLNASTADGHNPYRVMRDGFEWETLDPHDSWSFIGYWGDHQVIYLLKLLELSRQYHPRALESLLDRRLFTFADVPYRIKPYAAMLLNPRDTIAFDAELDQSIMERAAKLGSDGKKLHTNNETVERANLAEKLLLVALARLFHYIAGAGIWMNTQRPEWNDANNALVGYGASMVTLCYLRRYLKFIQQLFDSQTVAKVDVSEELADAFHAVALALGNARDQLVGGLNESGRKSLLDALATAGEQYRAKIYTQGFTGSRKDLLVVELNVFCADALAHIEHSIASNMREDGLYHAYNLIKLKQNKIQIRSLYEMLEGQVAVLSSGLLNAQQSIDLLDALRSSKLYREDQQSYVLYPDRILPGFFVKNSFRVEDTSSSDLLVRMINAGDQTLVARDSRGVCHFNAEFRNAGLLEETLLKLEVKNYEKIKIHDLYESVFDHESFTGRSGTFYKYEGLGCIYWHMVSKLALEVQCALQRAIAARDGSAVVEKLRAHYEAIRAGIGAHKQPAEYGAIPTDPYSHTPGFAGVQQPGMTGQVKEDILARLVEMGVQVSAGKIIFNPLLVSRREFLTEPCSFAYVLQSGEEAQVNLHPGTMAFTLCQTPVIAHSSGPRVIEIIYCDGKLERIEGLQLSESLSEAVFCRNKNIKQINVFFGLKN